MQIISSEENKISPHELAINRLLQLDANGFSKEFYSELSHITRQFVEKSFYIRALEMTTEEISKNENIFKINDDIFSEWVNLLQKADLIKFAKKSTPISEMEDDKNVALDIIKRACNCRWYFPDGYIYQNHSNTVFYQFNYFYLDKTRDINTYYNKR